MWHNRCYACTRRPPSQSGHITYTTDGLLTSVSTSLNLVYERRFSCTKSLINIRSLRYLILLLTLGGVAVALAAADSSVPTQAALQPPTPQRMQLKSGLPNYDIRLDGKSGFEDFDLTSTPGRAGTQQNAAHDSRLPIKSSTPDPTLRKMFAPWPTRPRPLRT
jgi:hypothetical protein